MCLVTFSWTSILSCSTTISTEIVVSWTRILYSTAPSDSVPPIISRLLLLEFRMLKGPKLPMTHHKLIVGASTMAKRDIMPTHALIHALVLISPLQFKGPKLPKTHRKLVVGASTVAKRDIMPTDAPIRALVLISPLQLHLPLPVEPILFWLPPS
jgi:hypothetical protein